MIDNIEWWWCCLHPLERSVLRATIEGEALTIYQGIPLELWNTFWISLYPNGQAMRDAFLIIYGLRIVTIEIGEPPVPVEVVQPIYPLQYAAWFVFIFTPAAACLDGCQQSDFP